MSRNTLAAMVAVACVGTLAALGTPGVHPVPPAAVSALPVADSEDVLTSSWFCPSAQGGPGVVLTTTIEVANTSETARAGTVTWLAVAGGAPTRQPFAVAPGAIRRLRAVETGPTPAASALIEVDGGGLVVEQVVTGARGTAVAPCASDTSGEWYLANGTTLVDATEVLSLFNPFPADAVVDIEFATENGREAPGGAQGVVIAAGATTFVDVGSIVRRQAVTASSVRARAGRVVVGRFQSFDGTQGRTGQSLALAARAATTAWSCADGVNGPGYTYSWHVLNPGAKEADVTIEVHPDSGDTPEPIDITVPARSQVVVPGVREDGVAEGAAFASTVRSNNDIAVVVECSFDIRPPAPRRGWSSALGSPTLAGEWAMAYGDASAGSEQWLSVFNPSPEPVAVNVDVLTASGRSAVATLQGRVLPPVSRISVRLADHLSAAQVGIVVRVDGPVVVDRSVFGVVLPGVSIGPGVPLAASIPAERGP